MFRAYDIRGRWGIEIDEKIAKRLGYSCAKISKGEVFIGHDVRLYNEEFFRYFSEGFLSEREFYYIGLATTPLTKFLSRKGTGINLTSSHNPPGWLGIKMSIEIMPIESVKVKKVFEEIKEIPKRKHEFKRYYAWEEYFEEIEKKVQPKRFKIGFDPGNGVGFLLIDFMKKYFEVHSINDYPDGRFPSHIPNPIDPKNLEDIWKLTKEHNLDFGVAFDGDCDRIGIVLREKILEADEIFYLLMRSSRKVLAEITLPITLEEAAEDLGVKLYRTRTGYFFCMRKARELGVDFFGEYSGHFGFKDFYYIDDALFTLLKFAENFDLKALEEYKSPLQEMVNFEVKDPKLIIEKIKENLNFEEFDDFNFIDGIDIRKSHWRIIMRPSNTENKIRVKFESRKDLKEPKKFFEEKILPILKESKSGPAGI